MDSPPLPAALDRSDGTTGYPTPPVIARLNAATNAALSGEPMRTALAKLGAEPRGGTPQDLADHIQREIAKWNPIVATLNVKAE